MRKKPPHILTIEGDIESELALDLREILPEECALSAALHIPQAAQYVYDCLMLQEHRGEHSVGIVSQDAGHFKLQRHVGSVKEHFLGVDIPSILPGQLSIGHNRYATKGDPYATTNIQPLFFQHSRYGAFAIAHNGTLTDRKGIRERFIQEGVLFQSSTDSELLGQLIAHADADTLEDAIIEATQHIPAAYAMLVMSEQHTFALRDRYGVRPLSIGQIGEGYLLCSESFTFDQYPECTHIGDVSPGEMIIFTHGSPGFRRRSFAEADEHFCIFEGIYFSDPRSQYNGYWHEDFRHKLGQKIHTEHPELTGDCIVPILDSGRHAAWGLSESTGIPYRELFQRLHNPPRSRRRSFTAVTYEERARTAYQKLHLRPEKVRGKDIIVVDDSIVRSTTMRIFVQRLREAGAHSVTVCISAPPIQNICPYGMDFQEHSQLIAYRRTIEEIRTHIQADRLIYLSLEGLQDVVEKTYRCGTCNGCFGGRYPVFGSATPAS